MNDETYEQKLEALYLEAVRSLEPRLLTSLTEKDREQLVAAAFKERLQPVLETDPEFKEAVLYRIAQLEIEDWILNRQPHGQYRLDAIIRFSPNLWVGMPGATREHLLSWRKTETLPANLAYIESRLALWEEGNYKTLEELEAAQPHQ